jgi:hypothetical protein
MLPQEVWLKKKSDLFCFQQAYFTSLSTSFQKNKYLVYRELELIFQSVQILSLGSSIKNSCTIFIQWTFVSAGF